MCPGFGNGAATGPVLCPVPLSSKLAALQDVLPAERRGWDSTFRNVTFWGFFVLFCFVIFKVTKNLHPDFLCWVWGFFFSFGWVFWGAFFVSLGIIGWGFLCVCLACFFCLFVCFFITVL